MPIHIFGFEPKSGSKKIPFYQVSVSAGVPVPVESDSSTAVDLNELLVERPTTTFFARVTGDDMKTVGISNGDVLIVDTSIEPKDGKIILALLNGELTVRYYRNIDGEVYLETQSSNFLPLKIGNEIEFEIIGTVTKIIHTI